MAEGAYLSAADRLKQHQTDDLKTRYLKLVLKNPALFQNVPQHYIASYLGVKPRSTYHISLAAMLADGVSIQATAITGHHL